LIANAQETAQKNGKSFFINVSHNQVVKIVVPYLAIAFFQLIVRSNIQHVCIEPLFLRSKLAAKWKNCNNKNQLLFHERENIQRDTNIKLAQERYFLT
jgi:hypothetical protein